MDRIALDIETIPLVDNPSFDNPEHWTIFAIATGVESSQSTESYVEVFFREDSTLEAEADLINETIDWVATNCDSDSRMLITYNGEGYDLPILRYRATVLDDSVPGTSITQRLYFLLETSDHADLIQDVKEIEGYYRSLDDTLKKYNIESGNPTWMDEEVTGEDMPSFGLKLLSDEPNQKLRDVTYRYAASDVKPLFQLYNELRGEHRSNPRTDTSGGGSHG
jgi:DNA polymerase elongation subunit (family B)